MPRVNAPSFATVADLAARVGEPITTDEDVALATSLLATVSAEIRAFGDPWPNIVLAPDICWATCVRAAARGYENPAGYELERGDQQTIQRSRISAGGEALTEQEIRAIRAASDQNASMWIVQVVRDVIVSDKQIVGDSNASISLT